jgi:hypothetical protein
MKEKVMTPYEQGYVSTLEKLGFVGVDMNSPAYRQIDDELRRLNREIGRSEAATLAAKEETAKILKDTKRLRRLNRLRMGGLALGALGLGGHALYQHLKD